MSNTRKPTMSVKDRIKGAKPQRRSARINLRGDLVAEIEQLVTELRDVMDNERETASTRRLASKSPTKALADKIDAKRKEMADEWLDLELEQRSWAVWREFKNANPPRDDNEYDQMVKVNFDALAGTFLPTCVVEPELDKEDWDGIFTKCAPADIRDLAALAFSLHEQGLQIPKSPLASAVRSRNAEDSGLSALGV